MLTQHRLATEANSRYRPFFNTALVSYVSKLMKELDSNPSGNCKLVADVAKKMALRAKSLGIDAVVGGQKQTYVGRIEKIEKKINESKNYAVGARLLFRETMRLMCAVRSPDMMPQLQRISDSNEAADLLHESFRAMISTSTPEAKTLENLKIVISIGCGSWGEVFFEKHQGDNIQTYLYTGLYSDLFCSFVNKYVADPAVGAEGEADLMLAALLELTSIHPCAEQCAVFQAEKLTEMSDEEL